MKILPLISLSILLLISIGANGFFMYQNGQQAEEARKASDAHATQASSLRQQLTYDGSNLATATTLIQTAQAQSDRLDHEVATLSANNRQLSQGQHDLSVKLSRALCYHLIPSSSIQGVTSNAALVEPITKIFEDSYGETSIETTYNTLWNNSKDAIFTITNAKRQTVKVAVSWNFDTSNIEGIYDIGRACYFYLP